MPMTSYMVQWYDRRTQSWGDGQSFTVLGSANLWGHKYADGRKWRIIIVVEVHNA